MSLVRLERLLLFRQRDSDLVIAISPEGIVVCLIHALANGSQCDWGLLN